MSIWFEKYRPKSMDDIVISDNKKKALREWFTKFKSGDNQECGLLFTGPPGLGKTSMAHIILREFGYRPKEFNASDIRSKILVKDNLNGLINITDVNRITGKKILPIGIIMDEVDGMFKGDRGGIDELLSYISVPSNRKKKVNKNNNRTIPIICICNIGNIKKETIKNLQKECYEIRFSMPDTRQMTTVLNRIVVAEDMTVAENAVKEIVDYSQGDFRRLIGILEFLCVVRGKHIDKPDVEWAYDVLSRKEQDLHITDSIRGLINNRLDGHTIHTIYDGDKSKAPMVVHQNYLRAISVQKTTPFNRIENAISCIDNLIISDVIEKTMYNTQCWYLQPIQGYTCTTMPNYYINKYPKTAPVDAVWASVLSVNSQSQNLKKNMYQEIYAVDRSHGYSIEDIQTIIEVIMHHIISGNTETAVKMLLSYNLTDLEDCLKPTCRKKAVLVIDKIAKYIKISPWYKKWVKFRDANKSNRDLDQSIRDYVKMYNKGMTVTTSKPVKLPQPSVSVTPKSAGVVPKTDEEQRVLARKRKSVVIKVRKPK